MNARIHSYTMQNAYGFSQKEVQWASEREREQFRLTFLESSNDRFLRWTDVVVVDVSFFATILVTMLVVLFFAKTDKNNKKNKTIKQKNCYNQIIKIKVNE